MLILLQLFRIIYSFAQDTYASYVDQSLNDGYVNGVKTVIRQACIISFNNSMYKFNGVHVNLYTINQLCSKCFQW